jgi:Cdc6-like AAA superfamily ATPase
MEMKCYDIRQKDTILDVFRILRKIYKMNRMMKMYRSEIHKILHRKILRMMVDIQNEKREVERLRF